MIQGEYDFMDIVAMAHAEEEIASAQPDDAMEVEGGTMSPLWL